MLKAWVGLVLFGWGTAVVAAGVVSASVALSMIGGLALGAGALLLVSLEAP